MSASDKQLPEVPADGASAQMNVSDRPASQAVDGIPVADAGTKAGVDKNRRRFSSAGIAGTGVILSVASRSAMGGWGGCTGSEIASGNLSRMSEKNPCGCSPGYWWNVNGNETWDKYLTAYPRLTSKFNTVFGVYYFSNIYMKLNSVGPGTNNPRQLFPSESLGNVAMHAVAALLNAKFYGTRFPVAGLQTAAAVISAFQAACVSPDALKAFVARVDVYNSSNTWCDGKMHGGLG